MRPSGRLLQLTAIGSTALIHQNPISMASPTWKVLLPSEKERQRGLLRICWLGAKLTESVLLSATEMMTSAVPLCVLSMQLMITLKEPVSVGAPVTVPLANPFKNGGSCKKLNDGFTSPEPWKRTVQVWPMKAVDGKGGVMKMLLAWLI